MVGVMICLSSVSAAPAAPCYGGAHWCLEPEGDAVAVASPGNEASAAVADVGKRSMLSIFINFSSLTENWSLDFEQDKM